MKLTTKAILITLLFGLPTVPLGRILWHSLLQPSPEQMPYFIGISLFEALGFGAGIAFLVLAWKYVKNADGKLKNTMLALYIATAWLSLSWWPHGHFHSIIKPTDIWSLLLIEYAFHAVSIIAAVVAAVCVLSIFRNSSNG